MADIRFQSIEDGPLADIWYALGGAAVRHPEHFKGLMDDCFEELESRRGDGPEDVARGALPAVPARRFQRGRRDQLEDLARGRIPMTKAIAFPLLMLALLSPSNRSPRSRRPRRDGAVFVAYYWRARPGQLEAYNQYIKTVAELIDEDARKAGVFEEVRTVNPGAGHERRLDAPADLPAEERRRRAGARGRARRRDAARRARRGQAEGEQRAVRRDADLVRREVWTELR